MLSAGLLDKNPRSVPSCSSHQAIRKADLSVKTLSTLIWRSTLLLAVFGSTGCSASLAGPAELQSLTPASAAAIDESAHTCMHTVAHDVPQEGPVAWLKFFNTGPEFFMAVNGQLAFPNAAAAKEGTENFARTINRIDLTAMLGRQSKERLYCRDSGRVILCCDFPELHAGRDRGGVPRLAQNDARLRSAASQQAFPPKSVLGVDESRKVSLVLTIAWNYRVLLGCALGICSLEEIVGNGVHLTSRLFA
jgi:hypothetical protein